MDPWHQHVRQQREAGNGAPIAADPAAAGARRWSPGGSRDGDSRGRRLDVRRTRGRPSDCGVRGPRLDLGERGQSARMGGCGVELAGGGCDLRDDDLTTGSSARPAAMADWIERGGGGS